LQLPDAPTKLAEPPSGDFLVLRELRRLPRLVEVHDLDVARAVEELQRHDPRLAVARQAVLDRLHSSHDGRRLTDAKLSDRLDARSIDVGTRVMVKELTDRLDPERLCQDDVRRRPLVPVAR